MNVLVIDIGGTHVKLCVPGKTKPLKFDSGPEMKPAHMVSQVLEVTAGWPYNAVSIGFPSAVVAGRIKQEPKNLQPGWVEFDFARAFKKPVRVVNDAAMQALGSYRDGRMLFLGLGTGLGSALISDKVLVPVELSDLRFTKHHSLEDALGKRGLKRLGLEKWQQALRDAVLFLRAAFVTDYIVIGGGNVKKLKRMPPGTVRGQNNHAFLGGQRLWEIPKPAGRSPWRIV